MDKKLIDEKKLSNEFLSENRKKNSHLNAGKDEGNLKMKDAEKISASERREINLQSGEKMKISSMYRRILNGEEGMDWETFQQLVETLHPAQRELWRDVCKFVKNEAKRIAGSEVYIEVKSISRKSTNKENNQSTKNADEISIEMDMNLKDVEDFFENKLKSCLINRNIMAIKMPEEE